MQTYNQEFYEFIHDNALEGAIQIVPFVLELIQPKSVVDVGCGLGTWLSIFQEQGVEDILGIDGEFIDIEQLKIDRNTFIKHDLTQPIKLERYFDLVVSLEVAEHLPEEQSEEFVKTLTNLGSVILFSAAIPYQPGTNHINCQWPKYWAEIFERHGYLGFDCLRMKFWNNQKVPWWYSQNTLLFIDRRCLDKYPNVHDKLEHLNEYPPSLIHPNLYSIQQESLSVAETWLTLKKAVSKAINRRLRPNK